MATKATDQAEESEAKVKGCIAEKESLLQKFSYEKEELLAKLKQLQDVINDKDQELKVTNLANVRRGLNSIIPGAVCRTGRQNRST